MIDAADRQEFAHLLEAYFYFSAGNNGADALPAFDPPALAQDPVRNSQPLKQPGGEIFPAGRWPNKQSTLPLTMSASTPPRWRCRAWALRREPPFRWTIGQGECKYLRRSDLPR